MKIWQAFLYLAAFAALIFVFVWGLGLLVDARVVVAMLGLTGAVVVASFNYRAAKSKEVDARLFPEKEKVYSELTETIITLFLRAKNPTNAIPEDELVRRLHNIKAKLLVWGSFETLYCLDQMGIIAPEDEGNPTVGIVWVGKMFSSMRKDLGHTKDPDNAGLEAALGLLVPEDREQMRQLI